MVLLAAAVCNKSGKAIVSRQFVEMNRARIEGLLAAFPKLMTSGGGKQHTFVETESVRYVYQPLEKLYVLLITTKASNILEDLETLRLFARVIPEYCKSIEESEITDQAFPLIFAFDEIVALGYRENVNLAQIRTFTEMDSHEEKVYDAVRQTQEREARENMKRRAKELEQARRDAAKKGTRAPGFGGFGSGSSSMGGGSRSGAPIIESTPSEPVKPSYTAPSKPTGTGRAMKLGSKAKDVDTFVDKLQSEGQKVADTRSKTSAVSKAAIPAANQEGVHIRVEEKINLTAGRDGGLQNMEVLGMVTLKISDENSSKIQIMVDNRDNKGILLQTHPNVDKKTFLAQSIIQPKNPSKPFPLNQDLGILKWRYQTQDDDMMPLAINCWPNETGTGCDVNIECEMKQTDMDLNDVVINIPLPSGVGAPVVNECDGEYHHDSRKSMLEWQLAVMDDSNKIATMEFSINGHPDDFFPVNVSFMSKKSYCDIEVGEVKHLDDSSPVKFSSEVMFFVDKYEIV